MENNNYFKLEFDAKNINESFARNVVAMFAGQLSPTLSEISDIKTAVSEAVTNCVVHAYPNKVGDILLCMEIENNILKISISDFGVGIANIEEALTPFYTSKPEEERSGMGFTVMDSFMDSLVVKNNSSKGITVEMTKGIEKTKKMAV